MDEGGGEVVEGKEEWESVEGEGGEEVGEKGRELGRERRRKGRKVTLAWWWIPSCLPLQSPVPLHLSGGTRGRGDGGGPGPGGFCGHLFPGAWFVKTLGQGVCV